jgi:hypothetical protein
VSALPWFRFGRMPDWLRLDLARSLRVDQLEDARAMFASWLTAVGGNGPWIITPESLSKIVSEDATLNPHSPVRDAIFLKFCNREEPSELDLEVPEAVTKAVGLQVRRSERWALAASLLVSAALLGFGFQYGHLLKTDYYWSRGSTLIFIVSFLVPNLRLQTKRGFSRFVGE